MGGEVHPTSLTSELEGDKMVLKIAKPPRDKDSIAGLAWQCCTWMVSSPVVGLSGGQHVLEAEHLASRSYLPSAAGQAAYYQVLSSLETSSINFFTSTSTRLRLVEDLLFVSR